MSTARVWPIYISETVILSTGTPIPARWTCRRRKKKGCRAFHRHVPHAPGRSIVSTARPYRHRRRWTCRRRRRDTEKNDDRSTRPRPHVYMELQGKDDSLPSVELGSGAVACTRPAAHMCPARTRPGTHSHSGTRGRTGARPNPSHKSFKKSYGRSSQKSAAAVPCASPLPESVCTAACIDDCFHTH